MIDRKQLTDEKLINISVSLALQDALVNEIYPSMRRVVGCINHSKNKFVLLIIYEGEMPGGFAELMDAVLAQAMIGLPDDFDATLQLERIDYPSLYEYSADGWYCFYAYFPHEEIEFDTVNKVKLYLNG